MISSTNDDFKYKWYFHLWTSFKRWIFLNDCCWEMYFSRFKRVVSIKKTLLNNSRKKDSPVSKLAVVLEILWNVTNTTINVWITFPKYRRTMKQWIFNYETLQTRVINLSYKLHIFFILTFFPKCVSFTDHHLSPVAENIDSSLQSPWSILEPWPMWRCTTKRGWSNEMACLGSQRIGKRPQKTI